MRSAFRSASAPSAARSRVRSSCKASGRSRAHCSIQARWYGEVSRDCRMPSREETALRVSPQTATTRRIGTWSGGATCSATSSDHTAHPPGTLRAAEPLPSRARADNSAELRF